MFDTSAHSTEVGVHSRRGKRVSFKVTGTLSLALLTGSYFLWGIEKGWGRVKKSKIDVFRILL